MSLIVIKIDLNLYCFALILCHYTSMKTLVEYILSHGHKAEVAYSDDMQAYALRVWSIGMGETELIPATYASVRMWLGY